MAPFQEAGVDPTEKRLWQTEPWRPCRRSGLRANQFCDRPAGGIGDPNASHDEERIKSARYAEAIWSSGELSF